MSLELENKTMKTNPLKRPRDLHQDDAGLSTVEYIIILILIAVAGITLWKSFGESVEVRIRESTTEINSM